MWSAQQSFLENFLCCRIAENVWKNSGFLKSDKGLLCTPDLVCSFFKLISFSKGKRQIY